jgi:hypothetical protein
VAQTVVGSVVNSVTGVGVAGVKVQILQTGNTVYSATTDAEGHFRIEGVKDGSYTASYSSPDFWDQSETPWREREARHPFQVTAGKAVKLEVHLSPLARITGRVIDGRGEAVPNARLELTRSGTTQVSSTDANGKFDLHVLPFLGAYTLSVVPPPGLNRPDLGPDDDRTLGWARTYYPGVAVPEAASKIVLRLGSELSNIEIKLQAAHAHAVRGVLLNPDGAPVPKVAIILGEDAFTPVHRVESKPDGTFEFPAVMDGEWHYSAEVESGGVKLRVAQWMEMAGHELEVVKLRLSAPFTVRGTVVMETPTGWMAPKPSSVSLSRRLRGSLLDLPVVARVNADNSFSLEHVYPGIYRLDAPTPPAYYLDAVRLGEAELAAPEVELSSGAVPITLVYKTNGGTVRGAVEKCSSGEVLLVPQDPAMRWPGSDRRVRCDSNDRYEIAAVRPGEYYALAFSGDGSSLFWQPKFDDQLLNQASRITVRAGEASSAALRAITQLAY